MSYGHSGKRGNLGPSERRKGQRTRCEEVFRLCWLGGWRIKSMAAELGMHPRKVQECITLLRRSDLIGRLRVLTQAGLVEAERLWPQGRTG